MIVLKDNKTILTLSRNDTSGPLKITELNTKQSNVIDFRPLLT